MAVINPEVVPEMTVAQATELLRLSNADVTVNYPDIPEQIRIHKSHGGHIALQGAGVYAVFQSSIPRGYEEEKSAVFGSTWYSYGRLIVDKSYGNSYKTSWNQAGDMLILEGHAEPDVTFHGGMLVLRLADAEELKTALARKVENLNDQKSCEIAAIGLYRALLKQRVLYAGEEINACAVYDLTDDGLQMVIINGQGGYSIGVPPREGALSENDLQKLNTQIEVRRSILQ